MRLGVLVSGRGSNLEAVLDAGFDVRLVVSNREGVRALEVAGAAGVPWWVLRRADFIDRAERDAAIGRAMTDAGAELALLAGYDQLLAPSFFQAFHGRTINIHPSLLPAHGGRGMVGLAVHRSVLASGDRETGVTIHEVTPELDAGPVLARATVAVNEGESAESLAARVLEQEHRLLTATLAELAARAPIDQDPSGPPGMRRASMAGGASRGAHPPQERPIELDGRDS